MKIIDPGNNTNEIWRKKQWKIKIKLSQLTWRIGNLDHINMSTPKLQFEEGELQKALLSEGEAAPPQAVAGLELSKQP